MKQFLILYFCYFEPMSLWYTNFTRSSGTVGSTKATLSAPVSLSCTHAKSTERARRQFGIDELNHGRVCATQARTENWTLNTELVSGRYVKYARLRPRLARKTYWTGLRTAALAARFRIRSIYTPSARTKLQTNYTCRSAVCYSSTKFHQQTHAIQTIRRVDRKHSVRFLLEEILVEWYSNCYKSLETAFWIFKLNFNLPFFIDCCEAVIISLQYPISYTL